MFEMFQMFEKFDKNEKLGKYEKDEKFKKFESLKYGVETVDCSTLQLVSWLVGNSKTARIFLISHMKLGHYKGKKVAEPDFSKKNPFWLFWHFYSQNGTKSDSLPLC